MIRAFVGVRLGADTVEKIVSALSEIKRRIAGVRWVASENIHLTLKFLGEVEDERIEPVAAELDRLLRPFPAFSVNAKGLGVFPDFRRPRVLWVGLEGASLGALALKIDAAMEPMGFARETREFLPHLTVGRWRNFGRLPEPSAREIERWQSQPFGRSRVDEVILFESVLKPQGAVYRTLRAVALAGPSPLN